MLADQNMSRNREVRVVCPSLLIPEAVWKRLRAYIAACPGEVGGLGTVEIVEGDLVVTDVFLLEQEVSSVSTVLDTAAVARFVADWAGKGHDVSLLRFWWHSHADFAVGWSPTDRSTMELLSRENFLVAYVGNHRGDALARLVMQQPLALAVDDLPVTVIPRRDPRLMAAIRAEVRAKVRRKPFWRRPPPAGKPVPEEQSVSGELDLADGLKGGKP